MTTTNIIPADAQVLINSISQLTTPINGQTLHCSPYVYYKDDAIHVSGEHTEHCILWIDYYGQYMRHSGWINPILEKWAKDNGGLWEWDDPGSISFYKQ
jgi:hypothetical protein